MDLAAPDSISQRGQAPVIRKLTNTQQSKLVKRLEQILEELDSIKLSIAAVHIVAAIGAVKDAETQGDVGL